jgi:putative ABC transport system permease protein
MFLEAGILALIIALLTVSYQSLKAASRNPVESLKYE